MSKQYAGVVVVLDVDRLDVVLVTELLLVDELRDDVKDVVDDVKVVLVSVSALLVVVDVDDMQNCPH